MSKYNDLSELELKKVIDQAASALKDKQQESRKEVISQIKLLAASIGVTVKISEGVEKSIKKVAPKYRNPNNNEQVWTGRGVTPKWMQSLIDLGHDKSDFLI